MKILTILGTRPEIIRLSLIIKKLDNLSEHFMIHTGQNYDPQLNNIFFEELNIRKPDFYLGINTTSIGVQLSELFRKIEEKIKILFPDKILILGDTNSALSAIIAERMSIPVYHMEAGNRCHDLKVPEEKNRKLIDSISTYAIPYTPNSENNLLIENVPKERIFISGNPINEVLFHFQEKIEKSNILSKLDLPEKQYFLVTIHRSENVDIKNRLSEIIKGLHLIAETYHLPLIFSTHPRTKNKLLRFNIKIDNDYIKMHQPFGFFDFVKLEQNAKLVLTDSGTVQEECCIFNVPTVTVRDSTERPETVMCGSNIISGIDSETILSCVKIMLARKSAWDPPIGYQDNDVSNKVIRFLLNENID